MLTKTRAEVRALVQRRARLVDHLNAHPVADLNIDSDESYRAMRDLVCQTEWGTFLKQTGALTLPTTAPTTDEQFVVIPVPTDCRTIKRLETRITSVWFPATEVPLAHLRMYNNEGATATQFNYPFVWCLLDQGIETTEAANTGVKTAGIIALAPLPTSGTYKIWYQPEFLATSADSGANGFYSYGCQAMVDYHVYHMAVKCVTSDNDSDGMLQGLTLELAAAEKTIRATAPVAAGPRTWQRARRY